MSGTHFCKVEKAFLIGYVAHTLSLNVSMIQCILSNLVGLGNMAKKIDRDHFFSILKNIFLPIYYYHLFGLWIQEGNIDLSLFMRFLKETFH